MHLVLFDIDDTLTLSQSIDDEIYLQALVDVFGFTDIVPDWAAYPHTTDCGILHHVFVNRRGRAPMAAEINVFRSRFVSGIEAAAARGAFREIHGAHRLLRHLRGLPSVKIGLATGGWSDSARCKMRSAGMEYDAFTAASADDAMSRVSIMQTAIRRVVELNGGSHAIAYVGDGLWDARACRELNIPFVGIATGARAERLRREGAVEVFPDHSDIPAFCDVVFS